MRKSNTQSFGWIVGTACALFLGITPALAEGLEPTKARLAELDRTIAGQEREIQATSKILDRLSGEIRTLRTNRGKGLTLLEQYRLQFRLRQAQEVSDRLADLTASRREAESARKTTRDDLARELDVAIESRRAIANAASENWKNRSVAAREMDRLLVERMQLSVESPSPSLPSNAAVLFRGEALKEEKEERLTALRDLERRMETEVSSLSAELTEVRKQRFLRNELSHLMDEEAFFAEGGFVRAGASRPADKTAAVAAAPQTADSGVPASVSSVPGALPATMKADTPVVPERIERDPLAQLASEFGFLPEQKRDVAPRTAPADTHVQWLETRISTIRWILDRLRRKTQELERQAVQP